MADSTQPTSFQRPSEAAGEIASQAQQTVTQQPGSHQQMDIRTTPNEPELGLRGGRDGEMCPGRFCFIIPCPLPCNFCVFPCPC
ncbi:hypothetical protein F5X68DRAFT_27891 [Plectosphaerella plurivora]|uniref:Uncharacterized protein n=1 Tax=Plectosphaerella plurivora TaxID=936078 RepID=A0A9P8VK50_9PEZI|nr:hypothetical protein F5X68DRAFT_27891 [Plectosphaerella plurivora]